LDVDLVEAIRIAAAAPIYAYDAYVLACARATGYPVMSLDRGLLSVAESVAIDRVMDNEPRALVGGLTRTSHGDAES
jgi:hypothetical protein